MRWKRTPIGWVRPGDQFYYRGDFRIRLHYARWNWHGLDDRRWHVGFQKADCSGGAISKSFTAAVVLAIFDTYRTYWRVTYCNAR